MKAAKLILLSTGIIAAATAVQAMKPVQVVRERFANGEAIKLDLQAQEQTKKGDLASAKRTVLLALQKDPTLWLTYYIRAGIHMREHKYELAIEDCNWVLRKYPKFIEAALVRANANKQLGKYAESLKELDHLVRIRPALDSYARVLQTRAWFLATCPNSSFRNGGQALQDAKTACKLTNWSDGTAIESLAAAYAETGDFDSAVRYAEEALGMKDISPTDFKRLQARLESFRQHKPIRSS